MKTNKSSVINAIRFALLCYTAYTTGKEIYRYIKESGAVDKVTDMLPKQNKKNKK